MSEIIIYTNPKNMKRVSFSPDTKINEGQIKRIKKRGDGHSGARLYLPLSHPKGTPRYGVLAGVTWGVVVLAGLAGGKRGQGNHREG